jgi:hypothetical protein
VAFGTPDVPAAVRALRQRGVDFVDSAGAAPRRAVRSRARCTAARCSNSCTTSAERGVSPARHIADFGMDTITLAGPLEAKLRAIREAGFGQVMLAARDLVGHPDGWRAAVRRCRTAACASPASRCCATSKACQGHLHAYKVDIAKVDAGDVRGAGQPGAAGLQPAPASTPAPTATWSRATCASWP